MEPQDLLTPSRQRAAVAASAHIPLDAPAAVARTFVVSTPGSIFIMPDGERHQFKPVGRVGHLTTTSQHLQAELDAVIKRGGQIRELLIEQPDAVTPVEATPAQRAKEALLAVGKETVAESVEPVISVDDQVRADAIAAARAALLGKPEGSTQEL